MFLNLRKSCLTKNISNRALSFISKWTEYVSLIFFKLQGTIMNLGNKLTVFQIAVYEKIQQGSLFYLNFLIMHVDGMYFINHKIKVLGF